MDEQQANIRIAAVGDIHVRTGDKGKWVNLFKEASLKADVLLLCGDLTDTGDEQEAELLADELRSCAIPVVAVLGNHDHEKGRHKLIRQIMQQTGVNILDGESVVIKGIGFAGVKGFGGGFGNHMLSMFGEHEMKAFVQEAVDQALNLDRALARLDQENDHLKKIAVLHYSPMMETIQGEPLEIFPFLGSSRLAEPLIRRHVVATFHGHAHAGTLEGRLADDVKVFNVAKPILLKAGYDPPLFIYDV
ncbi:metallophosphoesterase [Mucilaginibacter hurinus]|uniref:Metallophosphoesterase n=1 Tax=Mucilaginibacter hurinus TaxID=2201324 RepID=A0A367GMZ5_9SPHI|nr:metallophosphoesterase [Mucilaginibacter hurinus]RCH54063.1 metallophosphoesterase [Mucilaginibacter hurinus]